MVGLLAEKVALITGAGSGIGRSAACLFAREGAKVMVADVDEAGGRGHCQHRLDCRGGGGEEYARLCRFQTCGYGFDPHERFRIRKPWDPGECGMPWTHSHPHAR